MKDAEIIEKIMKFLKLRIKILKSKMNDPKTCKSLYYDSRLEEAELIYRTIKGLME